MAYKVLDYFTDLQDKNYAYNEGDIYPREGLKPTKARIHELASDENGRGEPVIVEVEDPAEPETVNESGTPEETEPEKPKKGRGNSKK